MVLLKSLLKKRCSAYQITKHYPMNLIRKHLHHIYIYIYIYIIIYLLLTILPLLSLKRYYLVTPRISNNTVLLNNNTTLLDNISIQPLLFILTTLLFINFFIVKIIKKCNDRYKLIDRIVEEVKKYGIKQYSNVILIFVMSIILIIPSFTKIPKNKIHFKTKDKKSIVINYKVGIDFDNWFKYNFKTRKSYLKRNIKKISFFDSNLPRFLYELNLLLKKYPHLKDIDFMNTFIIANQGGVGDQVRETLGGYYNIYTKSDNKYKYKFVILGSGSHGGPVIQYFNFSKYMDFQIMKFPDEILNLYKKYSFVEENYYRDDVISTNLKIKPPFLSKTAIYPQYIDVATLRDMMQLQIPLNEPNKQKLQQIKRQENSVAIHIRMGDVLDAGNWLGYLPKISYFKKSIIDISKQITKQKKTNNITFFIFSNSMDLVKARLNDKKLIEQIKQNTSANITFDFVDINKDEEPYYELELMKNCQHFIISGGGFSRLASYLGEYKDKIVITPRDSDFLDVEEKEKDWHYKWDYKSNDWRNIEIIK